MPSFSKSPAANSARIASVANQYGTSATAYAAASTGAASINANDLLAFVGQEIQYNSFDDWWDCFVYQTFVEFDTPETGTVTAATLKVWLSADYSTTEFNIEVFAYDFDIAVNTGDFRTPTQLTGLTSVGSLSTSGIGSTGALKPITLNTSSINRSGPTRLLLASSRHRTATEPTGSESVSLTPFSNWVLEYTTTGNDPVVSRAQVGAVTRSAVQPAPSVSSVAKIGAVTRSQATAAASVTSTSRVGAATRSAVSAPSTTYLSDTFTGTNGASWNSSNWTTQNGTQTIQGNRGAMLTPGGFGNCIIDVVPTIPANFSFAGQIQFPSSGSTFAIEYRNNGTDYYRAYVTPSELIIYSTPFPTIAGFASISTSLSDLVNFRLDVNGTSHKLRFWLNSDPEPSTWNVDITNTVTTAAPTQPMRVYFGDPNAVTGYLDNVSVTSGGSADSSVASASGVGAVTRSTIQPEPSVVSRTQVGAVTRSAVSAAADFTVVSTSRVGAVARSTIQPEPSATTRSAVGVVTESQVSVAISVTAVAAVGAAGSSQPTITATVATRSGIGAAATSLPSASVSVNTITEVGAVTLSTLGVSGDVTATCRVSVGASTRSQPTITASVATVTGVGAATRSQPTITASVATVTGVGAATRSEPTITASVATVTDVGAATCSQPTITVSVATVTGVGAATRSQPTITVSIATVASVGVVTSSLVSASGDVTVTSGMFVGVTTRGQPTITASVATIALAGVLLQSGGAQVRFSTTSRGTVGVVTITTPGGEVVISFGPLVTFRSPSAVRFNQPDVVTFREPRTVYA